ncbi:MAG TPA: hypothetical protein VHO25_00700 [Polyangiaceae bacterium]|nr:hypothetical protein [Polyangiaceae bacterium]
MSGTHLAGAVALALLTLGAGGEPAAAQPAEPARGAPQTEIEQRGPYVHLYGAWSLGRGLRFNNPYRLQTELGDDSQSLSLTAPYLDLAVGALLGSPTTLQHGLAVNASFAIAGIRQEVVTPAYVALLPLSSRWQLRGRLGLPIVLEPDASVGVELGVGAVFLVSAGLGFTAEAIGSLFPGAATLEETSTLIPIASLQLGVLVDYEVLP